MGPLTYIVTLTFSNIFGFEGLIAEFQELIAPQVILSLGYLVFNAQLGDLNVIA